MGMDSFDVVLAVVGQAVSLLSAIIRAWAQVRERRELERCRTEPTNSSVVQCGGGFIVKIGRSAIGGRFGR